MRRISVVRTQAFTHQSLALCVVCMCVGVVCCHLLTHALHLSDAHTLAHHAFTAHTNMEATPGAQSHFVRVLGPANRAGTLAWQLSANVCLGTLRGTDNDASARSAQHSERLKQGRQEQKGGPQRVQRVPRKLFPSTTPDVHQPLDSPRQHTHTPASSPGQ